ncbi:FAD-dependent oxidoreductase [Deinococcus cavernae]
MTSPGQVWAHVGQPFQAAEFDVVVVGAGRMGAALALFLRRLAPHLSLLMVEEGGLPNEEGATILAPGLWTTLDLPRQAQWSQQDQWSEQAQWTREQLASAFGEMPFEPCPLIELYASPLPGHDHSPQGGQPSAAVPYESSAELAREFPVLRELANLDALPLARVDRQAALYRPASVALNAAQQAVRLGANLLLNTRARLKHAPGPQVMLERLTVTNTHQIVTHEVKVVRARHIVVAAGAGGPPLLEHGLGVHTQHGRAYQQYPRLNLPSPPGTPAVRVSGLTLRPQHGAFTLIPRLHHRDPHGYQPTGGHLTGVPTGLRREVLEDLVNLMDALPALAGPHLQVGRSLSDLPGAWVTLVRGDPQAPPVWETPAPGHHLLLGGPHADTLGLAVAHDLAQHLSQPLAPMP